MNASLGSDAADDALDAPCAAALDWAGERLSVRSSKRVASRPWGTTLKLAHEGGIAWLKLVPPVLAPGVQATALLARRCPDAVPRVVDADPDRGLLLSVDHGGVDLGRRIDEPARTGLLAAYAATQASAATDAALLAALPTHDPDALVDDLIRFLTPGGPAPMLDGSVVTADHFISTERCDALRTHLQACAALLRRYLARARALPTTVEHGDLRPSNAARRRGATPVLYDWEEAFAGSAGASLHAMFGGCVTVLRALDDDVSPIDPETLRQPRRELDAYIDALVDGGYADRPTLLHGLGAAALGGMLRYLVGFARFPGDDRGYRQSVRRNLKKRLGDLLDVCDHLCVRDASDADGALLRALADDYVRNGRPWRAAGLLEGRLHRHPDDAGAALALGDVQAAAGRTADAADAYRAALEIEPAMDGALAGLSRCEANAGRLPEAIALLRRTAGRNEDRSDELARLHALRRAHEEAAWPGTVPTVRFTEAERLAGRASPATVATCAALLREHGVLLLKAAFDPGLLERCREAFMERYRRYLERARHDDALRIGDRRYQVTMDLEPPYDASALWANELLLPSVRRTLGDGCALGCFTAALSLPGAEDQRLHKDHKALYPDAPEAAALPSFAVTTMVPLVDVDERVGTTRVKKGSHVLTSEASAALPYQTPRATLGDCYLMDYRLSHHGQANRSGRPRPILSLVYRRPWFRDHMNFHDQPPLRVSAEALERVPEALRPLLAWTAEPGPRE